MQYDEKYMLWQTLPVRIKHDPCTRSWCYKIELRMFYFLFHLVFYFILISFSVGKMSGKDI